MILYLCPGRDQSPYGGQRRIYRHVDALNEAGFEAAVVHGTRGHRLTWFANDTRIEYAPRRVTDDDLLVIPEVYNESIVELAPEAPRVVLNLNLFAARPIVYSRTFLDRASVLGVVTTSEYAFSSLSWVHGAGTVHQVPHSIDRGIWHPGDAERGRRIGFLASRGREDRDLILGVLFDHGALTGWELVSLNNLTEEQMAEEMRGLALFLSFNRREGFGRPPLEALSCGTPVIGYSGFGGREVFGWPSATEIPFGDTFGMGSTVEEWLQRYDEREEAIRAQAMTDAERVLAHYEPSQEEEALVSTFQMLLGRLPGAGLSGMLDARLVEVVPAARTSIVGRLAAVARSRSGRTG